MQPREPPLADRTSVIAPTPFAGEAVERLRAIHDWSARHGIPAHVTLLGPFVHPDLVTAAVRARLNRLFAAHQPFQATLSEVRRFGRAACLIFEDPAPLFALSRSLEEAWPYLAHNKVGNHVTLGRGFDASGFERINAQLAPLLPRSGAITEAILVERRVTGVVRTIARFRLGE